MDRRIIDLFGVPISDIPMPRLLSWIEELVTQPVFNYFVTFNPEILMAAIQDPDRLAWIRKATASFADGTGLLIASKWMYGYAPHKITGSDLTPRLLALSKYSFYLVGAKPQTMENCVAAIRKQYPGSTIVGYHHGYTAPEDEDRIISDICEKRPQIILVGMGFPKQDMFIEKIGTRAQFGLAIGIGGMIEVLSGEKKRAPRWLQVVGLEWIYRGILDPKRIPRWAFIPPFLWFAFKEAVKYRLGKR